MEMLKRLTHKLRLFAFTDLFTFCACVEVSGPEGLSPFLSP